MSKVQKIGSIRSLVTSFTSYYTNFLPSRKKPPVTFRIEPVLYWRQSVVEN